MNPDTIDKYLYIRKTPAWAVKVIYSFGIFSWLLVAYGYTRFIVIDPVYWWIIAPFVLFFSAYFVTSYGINFFYRQLDIPKHIAFINKYWRHKKHPYPLIDVFIPICGEDAAVLEKTFAAVSLMEYNYKKVYVLDDKGILEHKKLAENFGFIYLSREDKGVMKKAGNIKYGFSHSKGEFIVIFDADFAPHADFIKELLPYMKDQRVGIIQSPQYFQVDDAIHNHSKLEYGAANVQEDFYRFIQVARDAIGAPICCGSNALYRRAALESIGGTVQIDHSEDMYTGFKMMQQGWKVRYLPIILAVGLCPENLHPYFHQQHRWCCGSMSLMLYKEFWKSNLSFGKKMSFISGFMYYLSYPLVILLSFNSFFILFNYSEHITFINSIIFLPCVLFSFVVLPLFRISKSRIGNILARTACSYSYIHAIITTFVKSAVGWEPTNAKKITISHSYRQVAYFTAIYFLIYVMLCALALQRGLFEVLNLNYSFILFWIFYNLLLIILMLYQLYMVFDEGKVKDVENGIMSKISLMVWRFTTIGAYSVVAGFVFLIGFYVITIHI